MKQSLCLSVSFLSFLAISLLSPPVYSAPNLINYQGVLKDSGGPVSASLNITFRIYDADVDGTMLWDETQLVAVAGGIYNVQLGADTAFPSTLDFSIPYWLAIEVETDGEMDPRQPLSAVGQAIRAGTAEGVPDNVITEIKVADGSITPAKIGIVCPENDFLIKTANGWDCFTSACIDQGAELCNGIDDNCDGQIDEGFADLNTPCTAGLGIC